jgi:rhomboid family protein
MFPLRDNIPSRTTPVIVFALIVANAAVFLYETSLTVECLNRLILHYGVVPLRFHSPEAAAELGLVSPNRWLTLATHMFLHGGWAHVIGNMWFLWVFGDNVEDRMGHGRFIGFYLVCGLAGAGAQIWAGWPQEGHAASVQAAAVPMVGASGAIAGVLGAYLLLYPFARIRTLFLIVVIPLLVDLPALLVLGLWFAAQWVRGSASLHLSDAAGGVAWWAHIGGFVAGMVLVFPFVKRRRRVRGQAVVVWRA